MYANLLVVNLHVRLYKPERGESRQVFPRSRYQSKKTPQGARLLARGHAVFWVLDAPLAAGGGRTPHYRDNAVAHLRGVRNINGEAGEGAGRGNL